MTETSPTDVQIARLIVKVAIGVVVVILAIILAFKLVNPKLNLYRANTEKQAVIAEQRAESEAAEYRARSEVIQAQALADAGLLHDGPKLTDADRAVLDAVAAEFDVEEHHASWFTEVGEAHRRTMAAERTRREALS